MMDLEDGNKGKKMPQNKFLSKNARQFFPIIWLLLLTVVVIALVAYALIMHHASKNIDSEVSAQMMPLTAKTDILQKELTQNQTQLQALQSQLPALHQKMVLLTQSEAWLLAEAHYLVFLAKERLQLTQNAEMAKTQLEEALAHLAPLPDDKYASVKLALTKDIVVLSHHPVQEKETLWQEGEEIKSLLKTLQFKTLNEPAATDASLSDYPRLQKVLSQFDGIIKITREKDNAIPQALASLEKAQLMRILALTTEQIQWAILQGQGEIYQESLEDLKKLLNTYFTDDATRQNVLSRLDKLSQQSLVITIPDISGSLEAIAKAQAQLHTKENAQLSEGQANDTIN